MALQGVRTDRLGDATQFDQLGRHPRGREHEVGHAGVDGRLRHARLLGLGGRLDQGDAALFLDAGQARGAVRAHAGQDHADGFFLLRHGQRAQEDVDGGGIARRVRQIVQHQMAVLHRETAGGRNHVDVLGQDRHRMVHLHHRQPRRTLQYPVCVALLVDRQVQHDDQRHPRRGRQVLQQRGQCRKPSGRCADADDRERELGFCASVHHREKPCQF